MHFSRFFQALMAFSLLATGTLAFSTEFNSVYYEPVHIRSEGKSLIAPHLIWIQPNQYKEFALAIQFTDDFKVLAAHDGWKDKVKASLKQDPDLIQARLICDQPAYFNHQKNRVLNLDIHKTRPGNTTKILLDANTQSCRLEVRHEKLTRTILIQTEKHAFDYLNSIENRPQSCFQVSQQSKDPTLKAFIALNNEQTTCTYGLHTIQNLENKIDGLQGKMTSLLGQPLTQAFLDLKDPYAKLDFSKAPKLDAILISALVFRADYSGVLISRAIAYHASRGTQVRILVSDVISLVKDKALFDRLMASSPNVKVQLYEWRKIKGAGKGTFISSFHRTMHSKLFITLSNQDRSLNTLIHGGRNIHDGFALGSAISSPAQDTPYVKYGDSGDESWASWRDFEIKIKDPAFVEAVAQHFMHIWNRDSRTNVIAPMKKSFSQQVLREADFPYALVKHMVSVPFQDQHRLQDIYAKLIDSAQEEIVITTPYLRPPKKVFDALIRATQRGVKLKIITRIDLHGDTADDFLEEVNKSSINRLFDQSEIYEYTVKGEILHSKLMIIDRKMSLVSSVNLNHRSYLHDIEDGILIYSPAYTQKLLDVVQTYHSSVRRVTDRVKTVWWRKIVVDVLKDVF